jgi:hypothetical protein
MAFGIHNISSGLQTAKGAINHTLGVIKHSSDNKTVKHKPQQLPEDPQDINTIEQGTKDDTHVSGLIGDKLHIPGGIIHKPKETSESVVTSQSDSILKGELSAEPNSNQQISDIDNKDTSEKPSQNNRLRNFLRTQRGPKEGNSINSALTQPQQKTPESMSEKAIFCIDEILKGAGYSNNEYNEIKPLIEQTIATIEPTARLSDILPKFLEQINNTPKFQSFSFSDREEILSNFLKAVANHGDKAEQKTANALLLITEDLCDKNLHGICGDKYEKPFTIYKGILYKTCLHLLTEDSKQINPDTPNTALLARFGTKIYDSGLIYSGKRESSQDNGQANFRDNLFTMIGNLSTSESEKKLAEIAKNKDFMHSAAKFIEEQSFNDNPVRCLLDFYINEAKDGLNDEKVSLLRQIASYTKDNKLPYEIYAELRKGEKVSVDTLEKVRSSLPESEYGKP